MTSKMQTTTRVIRYELSDVLRSRSALGYGLFFLILTEALFRIGGGVQALLSLVNAVLILVPLVSIVFGTMYIYSARAFTELLLSQPVRRNDLYAGLYGGLVLPLSVAFVAGAGLPFLIHGVEPGQAATVATMMVAGVLLTCVFVGLAFVIAIRFEDRVRGLGVGVLGWLVFAVLYDGLILSLAYAFADYPLERPMIGLSMLNPVDLARILLLLKFDVAALMGYTGAVFERFFGSSMGLMAASSALLVWVVVPFAAGRRLFRKKDF